MSLEIPLNTWQAVQEEAQGEIWAPAGYRISCHLTLHLVKFWMERIPILPPSNKVLKKYNKKYHRTYLVEGGLCVRGIPSLRKQFPSHMSSGESGSQQLQLLFSRASIPARLRIILKEKINTDENYRYTGVVEEISLALVQSKLGGMTLHALRA